MLSSNRSFTLVILLLIPLASLRGDEPFGWRGDGSGRFPETQPPIEWSPDSNVIWKSRLPAPSVASPAISGDHIFVLAEPATLFCLHASTGEILWQQKHPAPSDGSETTRNTASTPVTDGNRIFAALANGFVSAHAVTGQRQWIKFVEAPEIKHGHTCSPLLVGERLLVHFNDFVALDARTGDELWRVALPARHATPIATRLGGMDVIVHPSGAILRATDGHVLARDLFLAKHASPIIHQGVLYVHTDAHVAAFRLPQEVAETTVLDELWNVSTTRSGYKIASPIYHRGLLYAFNEHGILDVVDAKAGEHLYRKRLPFGNRIWPSPALAGGYLFFSNHRGNTVILAAGTEYKEIAANQLDNFSSTPIFVGKRMYVRTERHLYCIGE